MTKKPRKLKTHCIHGHKYTVKNTRYSNRKNSTNIDRRCRMCEAIQQKSKRDSLKRKLDLRVTQKDIDYFHRKPRKTHCPNGHKFTMENSQYAYDLGDGCLRRRCKTCRADFFKRNSLKNAVHWSEYLIGGV